MRKTAVAIGLGMLMCAGCGKQPDAKETARYAHGHTLPDLVFAANAPVFDAGGIPYAEAVWIDGIWKIHDDGTWRADCRSEDEIFRIMRKIREKRPESRILISARGSTAFREISKLVREAARAGFWRVDFLVATGDSKRANHSILLKLPTVDWSSHQPDIEPFFISIDAQGRVFSGTGASRIMYDSDPADHALPKLDAQLELFAAAAKAAKCRPLCQVYANPAASYQRVIDLLARFHEHRIDIIFNDLNPSMDPEPIKSLRSKPPPPPTRLPHD